MLQQEAEHTAWHRASSQEVLEDFPGGGVVKNLPANTGDTRFNSSQKISLYGATTCVHHCQARAMGPGATPEPASSLCSL